MREEGTAGQLASEAHLKPRRLRQGNAGVWWGLSKPATPSGHCFPTVNRVTMEQASCLCPFHRCVPTGLIYLVLEGESVIENLPFLLKLKTKGCQAAACKISVCIL